MAVGPEKPVVSDTTPLINLVGVGLLDLLPQIYGEIFIANAVYEEYTVGIRENDPDLTSLPWLHVVPVFQQDPFLTKQLGAGEAATIALALRVQARAVLLDEQMARRIAREYGLPIVGTLGILLAAKEEGLLPAIKPIVDEMVSQGRHISERLRAQVLAAANEGN